MYISYRNIVTQEALLYNDQISVPPHTDGHHIHPPSSPQFTHQVMHNDGIKEPQQYPQLILGNVNKRIGHVHAADADKNKTLEYGKRNDTLGYSSLEQDDSSECIDDDDSGDLTHKKRNQYQKRRPSKGR